MIYWCNRVADKKKKSEENHATFGISNKSSLGNLFKNKGGGYSGSEHRMFHRRQLADRRYELRFEPGNESRRNGKERRRGGWGSTLTV